MLSCSLSPPPARPGPPLAATDLHRLAAPLSAGVGDLLVAPTRIVLDGRKGTEVILNNIGDDAATYRVSVEFRRMTPDGALDVVTTPTPRKAPPRT